jgi:hypothetical protein
VNTRRIRIGWVWLALAAAGAGYPMPSQPPPQQQRPVYRPPTSPAVIAQDQAAVTSAKADLDKATQDEQTVTAKYRVGFEATQPWIDASTQLKAAQADETAAKQKVMDNLNQNSDYTSALADQQKAAGDLAEARSSPDATPDILGPLETTSYSAQAKVKKMEEDAMAADPDVIAAGQKVAGAKGVVGQLNDQFQKSLADKPDWKAADQVVQTTQKRLTDAQNKLNSDT